MPASMSRSAEVSSKPRRVKLGWGVRVVPDGVPPGHLLARQLGIVAGVATDEEERRLDAGLVESGEDRRRGGRRGSVVEGQDDVVIAELQRPRVALRPEVERPGGRIDRDRLVRDAVGRLRLRRAGRHKRPDARRREQDRQDGEGNRSHDALRTACAAVSSSEPTSAATGCCRSSLRTGPDASCPSVPAASGSRGSTSSAKREASRRWLALREIFLHTLGRDLLAGWRAPAEVERRMGMLRRRKQDLRAFHLQVLAAKVEGLARELPRSNAARPSAGAR